LPRGKWVVSRLPLASQLVVRLLDCYMSEGRDRCHEQCLLVLSIERCVYEGTCVSLLHSWEACVSLQLVCTRPWGVHVQRFLPCMLCALLRSLLTLVLSGSCGDAMKCFGVSSTNGRTKSCGLVMPYCCMGGGAAHCTPARCCLLVCLQAGCGGVFSVCMRALAWCWVTRRDRRF
jgi:hypothetical protein